MLLCLQVFASTMAEKIVFVSVDVDMVFLNLVCDNVNRLKPKLLQSGVS